MSGTELGKSMNNILIFENSQCTSEVTDYTINKVNNKNKNDIDTTEFVVVGKNNENYKGQCSNTNITLTTKQNELLFYLKDNSSNNIVKKEIYNEKSQKNIFSVIKSKGIGNYKVEFINLANEKSEYFKMVSDHKFKECHIYYGEEQCKAPIICNIKRKGDSCEIMISPKIDKVFIIGLASFFFYEKMYNNENEKKNGYDSIARMSMPYLPKMVNKDEYQDKFQNSNYRDITEKFPKKVKEVKRKTLCLGISTTLCCCCIACKECECCNCDGNDNDDDNNNKKNDNKNSDMKQELVEEGLEFASDFCECCDGCEGADCACADCACADCACADCGGCVIM